MGSESKGLSSLSCSWSPRTKKIIQNLKEIVDSPEAEIYDVLVDCNMNPDEAVQRLLAQDTFHKVKSKRERRKEMKETQESKVRAGYNGSSSREIRVERSFGYNQSCYNDNGSYTSHHKGENTTVASSPPPPHFMSHVKGDTLITHQPSTFNSGGSTGEPVRRWVVSSTVQPSVGCQPPSSGTSSGHLSMADIVRMDRPCTTNVPEPVDESDINSFLDDQTPTVVSDADKDSKHSSGDRSVPCESNNSQDVEAPERNGNLSSDRIDVVSDNESEGYYSDSDPQKGRGSVALPRHLKALASDCPPLSFGTFNCGENFASFVPLQSDRDASREEYVFSSRPLETRNIGFSTDESLESLYNAHKSRTHAKLNVVSSSVESRGNEYIRPSQHESNVQNNGCSTADLSFARIDPTLGNRYIQKQLVFTEPQPSSDVLTSEFNSLSVSDSLRAQLLANQSIPSRLGNTVSSLNRRPDSFPVERQLPPGAFSLSSYSKPNLQLEQPGYDSTSYRGGHLVSYTKLPSTIQHQQFYPRRDNFLQPLPDLKNLTQYEGHISRVPGDFGASGYGSYRTSDNVPGSYRYSSSSSMGSNSGDNGGYRDLLSSIQQNSSSRMQPSAQVIGYNSLRGQNEQYAGYRQDQERQSQYNNNNNGALGYSDLYRTQPEAPQDQHQLRNLGGSTVGPRDLPPQQFHQFWQKH